MGADREQLLYGGAKSEGVVTWYTSLAGDSYKALVARFRSEISGRAGRSLSRRRQRLIRAHVGGDQSAPADMDALETTYDFTMVSRAVWPYPAIQFAVARRLPEAKRKKRPTRG